MSFRLKKYNFLPYETPFHGNELARIKPINTHASCNQCSQNLFEVASSFFIPKDECSYDVHKFRYSSQKKLLILLCLVIVLLINAGYCIWIWETSQLHSSLAHSLNSLQWNRSKDMQKHGCIAKEFECSFKNFLILLCIYTL